MALQSSGAISLNDIHVEAGGTTGTPVNLNDSDVRDLINASAGSTMDFSDWYGASNVTFLNALVPSDIINGEPALSTTITVTQGDTDDRFSTSRYFGFYGASGSDEGSVSPTSLTFGTPNTALDLLYVARRAGVSNGVLNNSVSAFWLWVKHPTSNTIQASTSAISGVTIDVDGGTVTLSRSDATVLSGNSGTYWVWGSNDFTSQQHTDFITEWDGSGTSTVVVNA